MTRHPLTARPLKTGYPVLMYHALRPEPARERYVLTADTFRRHLTLIRDSGCVGISLAGLRNGVWNGGARPVVITFDDGSASDRAVAMPLLAEFGFSATFFVTTARTGTGPEWLSWEEVRELRDAGMDVQSHGHTHRFLDRLPTHDVHAELETPQRLLEQRIGLRPVALSFPGGRYSRDAIATARRLGYGVMCTSEPGFNRGNLPDGLVRRFPVTQGVTEQDLKKILGGDLAYATRQRSRYRATQLARRLLGNAGYHALWRLLFRRTWRT